MVYFFDRWCINLSGFDSGFQQKNSKYGNKRLKTDSPTVDKDGIQRRIDLLRILQIGRAFHVCNAHRCKGVQIQLFMGSRNFQLLRSTNRRISWTGIGTDFIPQALAVVNAQKHSLQPALQQFFILLTMACSGDKLALLHPIRQFKVSHLHVADSMLQQTWVFTTIGFRQNVANGE